MALACDSRKHLLRIALLGAFPVTAALGAATLYTPGPPQKAARPVVKATAGIMAARPMASAAGSVMLSGPWSRSYDLKAGEAVEISIHLAQPSKLPANGRVAVEWSVPGAPALYSERPAPNPLGLYTLPTSNFRKVLHALDGDVFVTYRAPAAGKYTLRLAPVTDEEPIGEQGPRWREKGSAPAVVPMPRVTPWPAGTTAPVVVSVRRVTIDTAEQDRLRTVIECEPNDTPEQAQPITVTSGDREDDIRVWNVTGSADDVEFFDNGRVGKSGDDWFRIQLDAKEPKLLTAQLSMPGQFLAARIRAYKLNGPSAQRPTPNALLPVAEYKDGMDPNERVHQQDEEHRAQISRMVKPGEVYYLRVESNTPGYQLQLRTVKAGPYSDPRMAIRQGMYTQIGQVDAWLTNRPRGASIERRIRDSGNLLGTQCMSCHTQSGVWGPAVPVTKGYPVEQPLNYSHMINVMYECLRPTNELKDAANNTSLAPLDIGDGPAGTRAAGFNIVNLERIHAPLTMHAKQQIRTANYVLLTADPGGINAAGPGSNIGFVIVNLFSTEILKTAWEKTGEPKYFRGIENKAKNVHAVYPKFLDDIAIRMDYFGRVMPLDKYVEWAEKAAAAEKAKGGKVGSGRAEAEAFVARVREQLKADESRLRQLQAADGSWGFDEGVSTDGGKSWKRKDAANDPSPTALAISGLTSLGYGTDDPSIAKGVKALLAMQEPQGRWNKAAQTGFVTSAYALHALSRLYPNDAKSPTKDAFLTSDSAVTRAQATPKPGESLVAAVARVRRVALSNRAEYADILVQDAKHPSPSVRYWSMIGLGMTHTAKGVPALRVAAADPVKMVRDAGAWALRQTLLDGKGWPETLALAKSPSDTARDTAWQALNIRADAVMPMPNFNWTGLNALWDHAINKDPHPSVRAWAAKAAWQWWVWNPPVRKTVNAAWVNMLERPEANALVENNNRYASQMLFIVNGHKANGSKEHQYKELAQLFETLDTRLTEAAPAVKSRLARRLVAVAGTFFATAGGDGGPGQMGYITDYSGDLIGQAALIVLNDGVKREDVKTIKVGLEGASGVPNKELTEWLVNYSLKGPEELRQLAAGAVSDPRIVTLVAVLEQVEPQLAQVRRGALEPARRAQVSDPIIELWSKVNWSLPEKKEQLKGFFDRMIPRFQNYMTPEQIAAIPDAAKRAEAEREMAANWYIADRMGRVIADNPDLHLEMLLFQYFPEKFSNPLEAHFWLRNVGWMLTFKGAAEKMTPALTGKSSRNPEALFSTVAFQQAPKQDEHKVDPLLTVKDRALQLFLDMLKPDAPRQTRAIAVRMAGQTAFRTNPEVLRALTELLPTEKDEEHKKIINNILKSGNEKFMPELMTALREEKHATVAFAPTGEPALTKPQMDDILFFRDYVMPELSRQKRLDQQSCMGCHGVPGRVPSLTFKPADEFGYIGVKEMLFNYRLMQERVNLKDLERSKILRKPLNIQDGQEDGHQGGRRYGPNDEGYLLLKKWVEQQPEVQKSPGMGWRADLNLKPLAVYGAVALLPGLPLVPMRRRRARQE